MKKILFLLLIFFNFWIVFASQLSVKPNIIPWEYNFPIEINLISNDKEAKIFYYTDWEWRLDNIKEFKKPILLKEDTTIDFYATSKNFEDTLIQTAKYTFKYSQKIDIEEKNWKIVIKNNSDEIQNIWYWIIKSNNLNYEISPNTFIDIHQTYEIDYNLEDNEKVILYSPDKKVVKEFIFKKIKKLPQIEEKKETIDTFLWDENNDNVDKILNSQTNSWFTKTWEVLKNEELKGFSLNKSLKTSVIDNNIKNSKKENSKDNIYIMLWILILITLYNIWLFLRKSEKFLKKVQTKSNEIWKK